MNWHKPPLYPATFNRNELSSRAVSSYSESSPPEEINDDVLPVYPMPTSTIDQTLKQTSMQKKQQAKPKILHQQTNKMSQRQPAPNQTQHFAPKANTNICSAPSQFIDSHVAIPQSSNAPSITMQNAQMGVVSGGGGAKVGTIITADRRFGFASPSLDEQRTRVQEILRELNTYTLNQCHDKVRWFSTVVLQQLLDLELYTACSTAVEQCNHGQLKRMKRRLLLLSNEKKKFEQEKKQLVSQRTQLTKEKAELSKCKAQLEQTVKTLTPFETKCQTMKQAEDKLKMDKQSLTKELEEMRKRNSELDTKMEQMEREKDTQKRRQDEQETTTKRRVKQLEDELTAAKSKNAAEAATEAAKITAMMDETKFRELGQELKSKKMEVKQLRAELADRTEQKQRCADLEEQLKMSNESAGKYKHKAMKLGLRLRKKTEEQNRLTEEAISAKQKAEDELSKQKQKNAALREQMMNASMAPAAIETTDNASNLGLLNDRIRSVTRKRRELDAALALLGAQPKKRPRRATVGEKKVPLSTDTVADDNNTVAAVVTSAAPGSSIATVVEQPQQQPMQFQQQLTSVPTTTTTTTTVPIDAIEPQQQQQQKQQQCFPPPSEPPSGHEVIEHPQQCRPADTPSISPVTINDEQQQQQLLSPRSPSPAAPTFVVIVDEQQQQQSIISSPHPLSSSRPPFIDDTAPSASTGVQSSLSTITTTSKEEERRRHQQQQQQTVDDAGASSSSASVVVASSSSSASGVPVTRQPPPVPAHVNKQPNQQQLSAEQIVSSFMQFIRQRSAQEARSLVDDYLKQSTIPAQFQPIIAEKLVLIVATVQKR